MSQTAMQPRDRRIRVGFQQALLLIRPYVWKRVKEQLRSIWLIVAYLLLFQTLVLRLAVNDALIISLGLGIAIIGLTLFIGGLFLGLMPLGEAIGLRLPRKSGLHVILAFSFVLGVGATFAEPAIGVLRMAGASVLAWEAPLLFLLLNKNADYLVYAVGIGVGMAVMAGMLRFIYQLSLKPFIYILVGSLAALSAWSYFDPNLRHITGLAWDCGAVTTGPVTVPLVLALGIGICRVVSASSTGGGSGFGVVTLASLFPILAVLVLGMLLGSSVSRPMEESRFFSPENRPYSEALFDSREAMLSYAFQNAREESHSLMFDGGRAEMLEELRSMAADEEKRSAIFGSDLTTLERWAVARGSEAQRIAVFGTEEALLEAVNLYSGYSKPSLRPGSMAFSGMQAAARAIFPLTVFLLLVLLLVLREKLPRTDEVILGIGLAFVGMAFLSVGIESGLAKLGNQVGGKLPALFKSIALEEERSTVINFDPGTVTTAVTASGDRTDFFFLQQEGGVKTVPYDPERYDEKTGTYVYTPLRGPLFDGWGGFAGILVLFIFAFVMGYGATLAEPALNALAVTVEDVTVGTFRKAALIQAVAIGVGAGISLGVAKIVWAIPLVWLILPLYLLLLLITALSSEEYVNIGWDSAGVTTGPVTVPLVLAMGLGIGSQVGGVEGFGILAAASVCPILSVLIVGLVVNWKRKKALGEGLESGDEV
ncbi:MAG: DUF1538 domain-containing protein [Syntrophales bacterium]|nr:DUF1538 domain-containing protein [Syntrophales bacterium]